MRKVVLVVGAVAALAGCSAGTSEQPARDVGHGNPEDVVRVLATQDVDCDGLDRVDKPGVESAGRCRIDGVEVEVVHFESAGEKRAYEDACRTDTARVCASTPSWAIASRSEVTVRKAARAMGAPLVTASRSPQPR